MSTTATAKQRLNALFVDECREHGTAAQEREKGHMFAEISRLYDQYVESPRLWEGHESAEAALEPPIRAWVRGGWKRPGMLSKIANELESEKSEDPAEWDRARREAAQWADANRPPGGPPFPTGAYWTTGTHSGTHVFDPLYGWEARNLPLDWYDHNPRLGFDDLVRNLVKAGIIKKEEHQ